jgi:hypothetical protein
MTISMVSLCYITSLYNTVPSHNMESFYSIPFHIVICMADGLLYLCFFVELPLDHFSGKM